MSQTKLLGLVLIISSVVLMNGCASPTKRGWGSEVRATTTWEKFKKATIRAAKDPVTWIPAATAVVVLASGHDEEWTQRALTENWVYGSKAEASRLSDEHALLLDKVWMASTLMADSDNEDGWLWNKTKGVLGQAVIVNASIYSTNVLKRAIDRREPDPTLVHVEHEAFPSNHSTPPFTQVALIRRNLEYSHLNEYSQYAILTGSYLLATSAAYGRIECGLHHFSDEFAGAALGNFIGIVLYDTFFEEESNWALSVQPFMKQNGGLVSFRFGF